VIWLWSKSPNFSVNAALTPSSSAVAIAPKSGSVIIVSNATVVSPVSTVNETLTGSPLTRVESSFGVTVASVSDVTSIVTSVSVKLDEFTSLIAARIVAGSLSAILPNSSVATTSLKLSLVSSALTVNVTVTGSPLTRVESSFGVTVASVSDVTSIVTSASVKLDEFTLLIAARIVAGSLLVNSPNFSSVTTSLKLSLVSSALTVNVTVTGSPLTRVESSFGVTVASVSDVTSIVTSASVKLDEFTLLIAARIVAGSLSVNSPNFSSVTTSLKLSLVSSALTVNVTVTGSPLTRVESSFGVTVASVSDVTSIVTSASVKLDEFTLLIAARIVAGSLSIN
jgi:SepF-like predicted cell division protein (DUF552 family)